MAAPLFWARLTANLSFEALSTTFLDRLEVFSSVINLKNTLVIFKTVLGAYKADSAAGNAPKSYTRCA